MKTEWSFADEDKVRIPRKVKNYFDLDEDEDKVIEWKIDEENDQIILDIHPISEEIE